MDRGVKVAIFVASIVSLGLGLIWDQVLSHARVVVEQEVADELGPELIDARMGSPDIPRLDVPEEIESGMQPRANEPAESDEPGDEKTQPAEEVSWTSYEVQNGDSWWKIAHVHFKERGLSSQDVMDANPGTRLVPGKKVQIPPGKNAVRPPKKDDTRQSAPKDSNLREWVDYEVQDGDSWWKIAHMHFKERGLSSSDVEEANSGVKLVAGKTVRIPPAE